VFTNDLKVGQKGYITYHKINDINKFRTFVTGKYPDWKFATVYNNITKEKLEVIKP
jgi:hypothetical protein